MSEAQAPSAGNGSRTVALQCFSPPPASLQLCCRVERQGRHLQLHYRLDDPEELVRLPPPAPAPGAAMGCGSTPVWSASWPCPAELPTGR